MKKSRQICCYVFTSVLHDYDSNTRSYREVIADLYVSLSEETNRPAAITESIITENAKCDHVSTGLKQMESNLGREYRHG